MLATIFCCTFAIKIFKIKDKLQVDFQLCVHVEERISVLMVGTYILVFFGFGFWILSHEQF